MVHPTQLGGPGVDAGVGGGGSGGPNPPVRETDRQGERGERPRQGERTDRWGRGWERGREGFKGDCDFGAGLVSKNYLKSQMRSVTLGLAGT